MESCPFPVASYLYDLANLFAKWETGKSVVIVKKYIKERSGT